MEPDLQLYLRPTPIIDSDHPSVAELARTTTASATDPVEQAVQLYLEVRDGIRYDPYAPFHRPEHYRASFVLARGRSFCIPKASLLCALARACGIPSRVGFATVKNHLATRQLIEYLGSNVFLWHAFVELHLEGKWVKATPAFNRELCERHRVPPLAFNGREDSLFQTYNDDHHKYMEYVEFYGSYQDIPVAEIVASWKATYGAERVEGWIANVERQQDEERPDFAREEVWDG